MKIVEYHHTRSRVSAAARSNVFLASEEQRRPARVIMLAAAFSVATTLVMAGASEFFDHLDGGRYAEDIIRIAIDRV